MSNEEQNDQRLILHILSNTCHQRQCFLFQIICDQ